ncbi:Pyruvate dehydrogenase acetyl-transferring-phosphatase 2 mitochondrial [Taenia crassiceps]|uniref:Pyruvate dehydrogenase acetyl-transferring-phosphatase 2 mitochondrial n=1 Tax=Taenia crassiceps TaxID=6207 RepID=A0ABR4Q6L6_9CEST
MAPSRCIRSCASWPSSKRSHLLNSNLFSCIRRISRQELREFFDDSGSMSSKKMPTDEVNRRIFEGEFICFPHDHKVGFTANQLDVNRPVEDRWSAYRLGGTMCFKLQEGFYDSLHPLARYTSEFAGGHLFTVVDGHAGHTCAHAVNMLHADYITANLLPHHLLAPLHAALTRQSLPHAPPQASELAQPYLLDPAAVMTSEVSGGGGSGATGAAAAITATGPFNNAGRHSNWRLWGKWGPLDAEVNQRRLFNIHRFLEERILTTDREVPADCVLHANGNVYDAEGFLVSEAREFAPSELETVLETASCLRAALTRMDSDITSDAVPHPQQGLNKALLRIVLSGCVATSVFLPHDLTSLYILQVGDCGAVMGKYVGIDTLETAEGAAEVAQEGEEKEEPSQTRPKKINPADWEAELLVPPHNAQNVREVERLHSQHPVHESSLMIAENRLLCELIPLRAFGDIRYKMPAKVLRSIARLCGLPPSYPATPRFYISPPYLFATPQVVCHRLNPARDRFVILASDGLWDMLTPKQAVTVVAQHYLDYHGNPSLAGPRDTAASRLIRTALGGREMDPARIAMHLSIPANVARFYRDDITVQVIYPTP